MSNRYYVVDVVIHNEGDLEPRNVFKEFKPKDGNLHLARCAAHAYREEALSNLADGEYVGYNKVCPVVVCCKEALLCDSFTNTCPECGADYNFNGDMLASRSQWGEETGEHWSECI